MGGRPVAEHTERTQRKSAGVLRGKARGWSRMRTRN
nr:MAG TPA: hypothetical protein [Caudoviricetes sp.]